MAAIDSVYNYYLSTYGNQSVSRFDTHKKSELRNVYNTMVKVNKESPLYKIKEAETGDIAKFAIDVKESARNLQNVTASLGEDSNAFRKKIAYSTDEANVSVRYVGDENDETNLSTKFDIGVKQLASSQINIGYYLDSKNSGVPAGKYTFDFNTSKNAYEFQYNVTAKETNQSVQEKIASLMNSANVGVTASVSTDEHNRSALKIESNDTGLGESESYQFQILPGTAADSQKAMQILGFDQVSREAANSSFLLNGNDRSSQSNKFTINNAFEISLNGISEEDNPSTIGFKNDIDTIAENLNSLVQAYNHVISTSQQYEGQEQGTGKLIHEVSSVGEAFRTQLESIGLMVQGNGMIQIDKGLLEDAVSTDSENINYAMLSRFKSALSVRSAKIALNPMSYVNKVVVAYKNPGKTFNTPYVSSLYSGMMLDTKL